MLFGRRQTPASLDDDLEKSQTSTDLGAVKRSLEEQERHFRELSLNIHKGHAGYRMSHKAELEFWVDLLKKEGFTSDPRLLKVATERVDDFRQEVRRELLNWENFLDKAPHIQELIKGRLFGRYLALMSGLVFTFKGFNGQDGLAKGLSTDELEFVVCSAVSSYREALELLASPPKDVKEKMRGCKHWREGIISHDFVHSLHVHFIHQENKFVTDEDLENKSLKVFLDGIRGAIHPREPVSNRPSA